MPDTEHHIIIAPTGRVLTARDGEILFRAVRRHDHPIASSCDGEGVCDKCRVTVLAGMEHLSPPNEIELRFRQERPFGTNERLACQTIVRGDVTITTSYW
jgi:ferredoxin, 2Fe-2S